MVYCSECGMENDSKQTFCKECGNALIKEEYFKIKTYDEFDKFITKENKEELAKKSFTVDALLRLYVTTSTLCSITSVDVIVTLLVKFGFFFSYKYVIVVVSASTLPL